MGDDEGIDLPEPPSSRLDAELMYDWEQFIVLIARWPSPQLQLGAWALHWTTE